MSNRSGLKLIVIFMITLLAVPQFNVEAQENERTDPLAPEASIVYDDPIKIESDSWFTQANGVSSGSCTVLDPYIIEDKMMKVIDSEAIYIRNTTKHLEIRNCTIVGG